MLHYKNKSAANLFQNGKKYNIDINSQVIFAREQWGQEEKEEEQLKSEKKEEKEKERREKKRGKIQSKWEEKGWDQQ